MGVPFLKATLKATPQDEGLKLEQLLRRFRSPLGTVSFRRQVEPVETIRREGQQVGELTDWREWRRARHLNQNPAGKGREIEFDRLRRAGQVCHAQDRLALMLAQIG